MNIASLPVNIDAHERWRRQTDALLDIARSPVVQDGDVEASLALITRVVGEVLAVRYVNILRISSDQSAISSLLRFDREHRCFLERVEVPLDSMPAYFAAIRSGEIIAATDALADPRVVEFRDITEPMGVRSMLDVGFRIGRETSGVLCIASTEPRTWADDEMRFAVAVASLISIALSNHELQRLTSEQELLHALTYQDSLTGVGNRRQFERGFEECWDEAVRNDSPLSLVLIDLDHFKVLNDKYGHLAGDQCLKHLAALLANQLRQPEDLVARIGGEEFALLLPRTSEQDACSLVDRILKVAANSVVQLPGGETTKVLFSAGIASRNPVRHPDKRSLFAAADRALYDAKDAGRGRAEVSR